MPLSREQLEVELAALETQLPEIERNTDRHEVLDLFAQRANPLLEAADPGDYGYALDRVQAMLAARGLAPEDDGIAG